MKSRYILPALAFGVPAGIYLAFLGLAAVPFFQRHALYAHKFNTLFWHDVNKPEHWGFAKNQVTPFNLKTSDGETIYAWHVLPLQLYGKHQDELVAQPVGQSPDITKTLNFKLLKENPNSRLVISLHGNAGHIAQSWRPQFYHTLTDTSDIHILAIDYRGYGHSTGVPSEQGLILDAISAVNFALHSAKIPPSQIIILGQSLGTAVASGITQHFTSQGIDFASVILVAGFSSLPRMLAGYAIAGWVPILAPLRVSPWVLEKAMGMVVDKWDSASRLREIVRTVKERRGKLNLQLIHAANDWDIPCHEDDKLFAAAVDGLRSHTDGQQEPDAESFEREKQARTVFTGPDEFVATWSEGDIVIRQELHPSGGHNDIMYYAPVPLAVMRAFGILEKDV
ncbi:Alpha/Beta hydrolase protein [Naviculisporaceae sp. PSN 640]